MSNQYDVPMGPQDLPEKGALLAELPEILNGQDKRLLYVGASVQRAYMLHDLIQLGWNTAVIEIWPENAKFIQHTYGVPVICGDVVSSFLPAPYDLGLWWHGPEHVHKEYFTKALANLENACSLVVLGCPNGEAPQDLCYDNVFERHLWNVYPEDLTSLGYKVRIDPRPGHPDNILAWKRVR